jgi:hypothetical protein
VYLDHRPTEESMTTPSEPDDERPSEGVNLGKRGDPAGEAPFDPYRFGKPDHPIPAEYAPPGYTGPVVPPSPYAPQPGAWAAPPGTQPDNPFNNPPGTPYGNLQQPPYPYQYPPAAPGQYGPPPPPYPGYLQPRTGNGKAVAGLVLGILSIVLFWFTFFDAIFVILGLIFSIIAMGETKASGTGGRGLAVSGLVCSIIGAVLATVFTIVVFHAANACGGFENSDQSGWDTCFRDHLT